MASTIPDGTYAIVSAYRSSETDAGTQDVYRLYNPAPGGRHLYTTSKGEAMSLVARGWRYEGVPWRLNGRGDVPVWRAYDPNSGEHLLTTSKAEYDQLVAKGWRGEGAAFRCDSTGNWPVYRLYNTSSGEHFYTSSKAEYDAVGAVRGWSKEGEAFRGSGCLCLDVAADQATDGVNVQLGVFSADLSQQWVVSTREDGTRQLQNRQTGKVLDMSRGAKAGNNVQQWRDTDSRDQRWDLPLLGMQATINGTPYDLCRIVAHANQQACVDTMRDAAGANALLATPGGDPSQRWAFVPVQALHSGGVYELRPMLDRGACVDVSGGSNADGANVQVWGHNGGNAQKFYLADQGAGWAVINAGSGKAVDVANGDVRDGTNVRQWRWNASGRAQLFRITQSGTTVVAGKPCPVVSFGAANGTAFRLDVADALAGDGSNVRLRRASDYDGQQFALLPTTANMTNLPVPTGLSLAPSVGAEGRAALYRGGRAYPTWTSTDNWAAGTANTYQLRYRRRTLSARTGTWGAWTPWTAWRVHTTTVKGNRAWMTDGIDATVDLAQDRAMEVEVGIRSVGAIGTVRFAGATVTASCRVVPEPTVALGAAGWTVAGLRIPYTSDQRGGTTLINVRAVTTTWAGKQHRRALSMRLAGDDATSVLVPSDRVQWPSDGTQATIEYTLGSDLVADFGVPHRSTVGVAYDSSHGLSAVPEVRAFKSDPSTRLLVATVPAQGGAVRMWRNARGKNVELEGRASGGSMAFLVSYPFGTRFDLYTQVVSKDGDRWGTDFTRIEPGDPRLGSPCHMLRWDGGALALDLRTGKPLSVSGSVQADAEELRLNGRALETVRFGTAAKHAKNIEGWLFRGSAYSLADAREAGAGVHATYQDPWGGSSRVAVTGMTYEETRDGYDVTLTMVEEVT